MTALLDPRFAFALAGLLAVLQFAALAVAGRRPRQGHPWRQSLFPPRVQPDDPLGVGEADIQPAGRCGGCGTATPTRGLYFCTRCAVQLCDRCNSVHPRGDHAAAFPDPLEV
jgi:hypothetical protein